MYNVGSLRLSCLTVPSAWTLTIPRVRLLRPNTVFRLAFHLWCTITKVFNSEVLETVKHLKSCVWCLSRSRSPFVYSRISDQVRKYVASGRGDRRKRRVSIRLDLLVLTELRKHQVKPETVTTKPAQRKNLEKTAEGEASRVHWAIKLEHMQPSRHHASNGTLGRCWFPSAVC